MKDEDVKPQLMKLLGISDERIADKVLQYSKLINDSTTTNLVNTDKKKKAQELLDTLRANSFALAKELNVRAEKIIDMIASAYQGFEGIGLDTSKLNVCYILLVNELEQLYSNNKELEAISVNPSWKYFDIIEGYEWQINAHIYENGNDTGKSHIAQINRLCIIAGTDKPAIINDNIKKILKDTDDAIAEYKSLLNLEKEKLKSVKKDKDWYIPEYKVTYGLDGTILINDVMKLKKIHAGSTSDLLMEQALKNQNVAFKPQLGDTSRNLSTILSSIGFSKVLRQLFFPSVSKAKGIIFRASVTERTVKAEKIDTTELDDELKRLGAKTRKVNIEIPF